MKVHITIRDEHENLHAIAAYVNENLNEVVEHRARLYEYSAALFVALNSASEFERYRRAVEAALAEIERELASCRLRVEALSAPVGVP